METIEFRKKIIKKFDDILSDENKLVALDGVLDALSTNESTSIIPIAHYNIVEENREDYLEGIIEGVSWDELKRNLKSKYGL